MAIANRRWMPSTTNPTGVSPRMTITRVDLSAATSGRCRRARRLTTGITMPRRLANPSRLGGTRGIWARSGGRMISATAASRNPKDSPASRNTSRSSSTTAVSDAARAPLSVERSEFFRVCSRLLAIATLNGFGERCNLFDSRCEILCTRRLLLGSSCRLG